MPHLDATLRERFRLPGFRPGQREVIEALLEHGAALAVFPTGGGKSLCYQLPALLLDGVTVVISPLIALMKDQIDQLRALGIDAARLDSSLELAESRDVERRLREGALRILYVAPERFNNERFLDQLGRAKIALFAVDEAHCISEWGHNFRPDYLKLAETARALGVERVLALTATATPAVVRDVCASFQIAEECAVVTGFHRPNLRLLTSPTPARERDAALVERLRSRAPGAGIVYVTLQKTAEQVAARLAEAGLPARAYHAGMDADGRTEVQEWWKASDRATVVATIAFGMGIDKADVRYVYHYNLPKGIESWSQEIGRAGRDGLPSVVELLGSAEDVATLENFAYGDTPTRGSLRALVREVLGGEAEFSISLYELSQRLDIRPLVLRTALTYFELLDVLRQGTPFYAGYRVQLHRPLAEIGAALPADRARFLERVFEAAKEGRKWYSLEPAVVAEAIGEERDRIVRALVWLGEQGHAELQPSEARQRYTRLVENADADALLDELEQRFSRREAQEADRIRNVLDVITAEGCQTNAMLAYFGEQRAEPCGHCTTCERGEPVRIPALPARPPIERVIDGAQLRSLAMSAPAALGEPRQQARFLCGLSSPALTRARLTRNPLYGALEEYRFAQVLAWCEAAGSHRTSGVSSNQTSKRSVP
jgi:ATP-dependent DNA helicase RecQ